MQEVRLMFVGFGTVARGCARHLVTGRRYLEQQYGFRFNVVAIKDLQAGSIEDYQHGVDLARVLELAEHRRNPGELMPGRDFGRSALETIRESKADILIESTWTNLRDGEPGLSHITAALESGMDVVTSNKGPIALAYPRLKSLADANGRCLRFESTVMSGTPFFCLCESGLAGARITGIRGILNGTTNYILTEMAAGKGYAEALRRAQELGYAESNPEGDVEGYDPAAKITILANTVMGAAVSFADVDRTGITSITVEDLDRAARDSQRMKLIASAFPRPDGSVEVSVKPTLLPEADILAHVDGIMNALQVSTDVQPDVTVIGPGAGPDSAGYGLLNDVLAIHRLRCG